MIKEISVKELDKILKDSKKKKDYFVLDVRQSEERTYGTIKGDVLIPMGEISERLDEIPKNKKIVVCNIPGYATESVAEWVFGLILEHLRNLEGAIQVARRGDFTGDGFSATEILNKKFGII